MAKRKRLIEQQCEVAKIDTEVAKDRVFGLIEECTDNHNHCKNDKVAGDFSCVCFD